jgi:anaerobic ribonucleoside-triphosphate reductase
MIERVTRVLAGPFRSGTFRECRRCGTTVDGSGRGCPECGSADIARYDL